jgi:hypothetical protein
MFTLLQFLVLSYDILCQYGVNFWKRMHQKFPSDWAINSDTVSMKWAIPKFHLPAHILRCHREYSFNLLKWVGRTDGEGIERGWAKLNFLAGSTKEMGPGSRRDTLDDHMGDSNWKKVVAMGKHVLCRSALY